MRRILRRCLFAAVGITFACGCELFLTGSFTVADDGGLDAGQTDGMPMPDGASEAASCVDAGVRYAVQLAGASYHTCATLNDHTAWCWGSNASGQLGGGDTSIQLSPVAVTALGCNVASVAAGGPNQDSYSCAVLLDGTVQCWGDNSHGQLGSGDMTNRLTPVAVKNLSSVASVSLGQDHACAVTTGGQLYCWGSNAEGQCADAPGGPNAAPVTLQHGARAVAAGNEFTCALLVDGSVWCWGANYCGQVGITAGTTVCNPVDAASNVTSPVQILFGPATSVTASYLTACATLNQGVECWGLLVPFGTVNNPPSTMLSMNAKAVSVIAGAEHTVALSNGKGLYCWGGCPTDGGIISNPETVAFSSPPGPVTQAAAGEDDRTCVLFDASAPLVQCWGGCNAQVFAGGNCPALGDGIARPADGLTVWPPVTVPF